MAEPVNKISTVWNPAGFVEQKYRGKQSAEAVKEGIKQLENCLGKNAQKGNPPLVLIDITELGATDTESHKVGIAGIRQVNFKRAALYGPLSAQVLVNTLALVAGKKNKIRAFGSRVEAIKWLQGRSKI